MTLIKSQLNSVRLKSQLRYNIHMSFIDDHNEKYSQDQIVYVNDRRIPLKKIKLENAENVQNQKNEQKAQNEENDGDDENKEN